MVFAPEFLHAHLVVQVLDEFTGFGELQSLTAMAVPVQACAGFEQVRIFGPSFRGDRMTVGSGTNRPPWRAPPHPASIVSEISISKELSRFFDPPLEAASMFCTAVMMPRARLYSFCSLVVRSRRS